MDRKRRLKMLEMFPNKTLTDYEDLILELYKNSVNQEKIEEFVLANSDLGRKLLKIRKSITNEISTINDILVNINEIYKIEFYDNNYNKIFWSSHIGKQWDFIKKSTYQEIMNQKQFR